MLILQVSLDSHLTMELLSARKFSMLMLVPVGFLDQDSVSIKAYTSNG